MVVETPFQPWVLNGAAMKKGGVTRPAVGYIQYIHGSDVRIQLRIVAHVWEVFASAGGGSSPVGSTTQVPRKFGRPKRVFIPC